MVRYYNENPREASLREEIQHLKEKNAESAKLIGELMHEINLQHDGRKMELELYEQWKREFDSE